MTKKEKKKLSRKIPKFKASFRFQQKFQGKGATFFGGLGWALQESDLSFIVRYDFVILV